MNIKAHHIKLAAMHHGHSNGLKCCPLILAMFVVSDWLSVRVAHTILADTVDVN